MSILLTAARILLILWILYKTKAYISLLMLINVDLEINLNIISFIFKLENNLPLI